MEVYPAASLKIWHLPYHAYKRPGDARVLQELVNKLVADARWLELGDFEVLCRARHDAVDAVVAALTARAASRNLTIGPRTQQETSAASTDGWIAIPRLDSDLRNLP